VFTSPNLLALLKRTRPERHRPLPLAGVRSRSHTPIRMPQHSSVSPKSHMLCRALQRWRGVGGGGHPRGQGARAALVPVV
jgi:hypothetical protein